jgi:hypothetical protein
MLIPSQDPPKALVHWGVKGMKWGVRKDKLSGSSKSADHIRSRELRKRGPSQLSDSELRDLTKRLRLENDYKKVKTERFPSAYSRGKKAAKFITGGVSTVSALYLWTKSPVGSKVVGSVRSQIQKQLKKKASTAAIPYDFQI